MALSQDHDIDAVKRKNRELVILNQIAASLNHAVNLPETLQTALVKVVELYDLKTGWIWLLDETTDEPYLAAFHQMPRVLSERPGLMDGSAYCHCLDSYRRGDMANAANINVITCTRLKGIIEDAEGLRFHSTIPLYAKKKKLGLLNVASIEWQELSEDDLRILHTVGDFLSIAIERARLYERSTQIGMIEERNRLAREVHDTLAQGLAAIALQMEAIDVLLETEGSTQDVGELVKKTLALTRSNLEDARRSVLDLRAAPLEGQTLVDALATLATEHEAQFQFDVSYSANEIRTLALHMEIGLYRIAQEALTNVARHAQAQHVTMELRMTPGTAHLTIEDDGQGFDTNLPLEGRYGLVGINERAKIMGGEMKLFSAPQEGTLVEITVPIT